MTRKPTANSTYPKGGVSCSKDSFVVNQTLVFKIKFCGKSPALRVAAKRWWQHYDDRNVEKNPENLTLKTKNSKRKIKTK